MIKDTIMDMLKDIWKGLKVMGFGLLLLVLVASIIWGIMSAILVISGRKQFMWYDVPCWVVIIMLTAGVIGNNR